MHGKSNGKTTYPNRVCCVYTRKVVTASKLESYQETLLGSTCAIHQCECCGKFISDRTKYCSKSCSSTITNTKKLPKSQETKNKISQTLRNKPKKLKPFKVKAVKIKKTLKNKPKKLKPFKFKAVKIKKTDILGQFSKLFHCTCSHCGVLSITRISKKYCELCSPIYSAEPRNRFKFTFNIYNYPDLFDLELLSKVGFYAPRGKSGRWNPNGLSRDHKVSVNEALKNNYDPFYITHPLNCELMPHQQNNKKKSKSSITYSELVKLVDNYQNPLLQAEASNLA